MPLTAANFGIEIYFAAGEGLAFAAGLALVAGAAFFAVVPVVAAAGLGRTSGAGLAAVVCPLCAWFFAVFVFAGVSVNAAIGSAARARISMSFFM